MTFDQAVDANKTRVVGIANSNITFAIGTLSAGKNKILEALGLNSPKAMDTLFWEVKSEPLKSIEAVEEYVSGEATIEGAFSRLEFLENFPSLAPEFIHPPKKTKKITMYQPVIQYSSGRTFIHTDLEHTPEDALKQSKAIGWVPVTVEVIDVSVTQLDGTDYRSSPQAQPLTLRQAREYLFRPTRGE